MVALASRLFASARTGLCLTACATLLALASAATADCPPPPAGPPEPPNATMPCGILIVGTTGGVTDPLGEFTIVYRDIASNPVVGCEIEIDFYECGGTHISVDQPFEGMTMECLEEFPRNRAIVRATTDGAGIARFRIFGGADINSAPSGPALDALTGCAQVRAGGVFLGRMQVGCLDLTTAGGINPTDIALWLKWAFWPYYKEIADYNCSETVNPADLAIMLKVSFAGGSSESATGYCQ